MCIPFGHLSQIYLTGFFDSLLGFDDELIIHCLWLQKVYFWWLRLVNIHAVQFDSAVIDIWTQSFPAQLAALSMSPLRAVETALLEVLRYCPQFRITVTVFIALSYFLNCFSQCSLLLHLILPIV